MEIPRKKDKMTHNGKQNTTQKTEDCATGTNLKPEVNSGSQDGNAVTVFH